MLDASYILGTFVLVFIVYVIGHLLVQSYKYKEKIPEENSSFPWGHMSNVFKNPIHLIFDLDNYYKLMKERGYKFANFNLMYAKNLFLIHPDIIKDVMIKSFDHFVDRNLYHNEKHDPVSTNLGTIHGDRWRRERSLLSPTFSPTKLKFLTSDIIHCCNELEKVLLKSSESKTPVDLKDISTRLTTDVIGRCAFGVECNSLTDPEDLFRKYVESIVVPEFKIDFKLLFCTTFPNFSRKIGIKSVPEDVSDFFLRKVQLMIAEREKNGIERNDLLHLMNNLKNEKNEKIFTMNQIAGHAFVYFTAGFETSALTLTYCLYELSKNQEVQDRARKEIKEVLARNNNILTFEMLADLKYLQQIMNETLRMRPPIPMVTRTCVRDYKIPNTDILLKKSSNVSVSLYSLQNDPEYFPNPEKFDPDRFSEENKSKIRPCTFIPFGEGPRSCIGYRFAVTELKISLVTILKTFRITLNEKTPEKINMHPKAILLVNKDKIYVDFEKLED